MEPNGLILYVDNTPASVQFYAGILEKQPVQNSENFALFILGNGMSFGLWAKHDVQPKVLGNGPRNELYFKVADRDAVDRMYSDWKQKALAIAQDRVEMDFGYTFTALDPDGHRLRVFALGENPV